MYNDLGPDQDRHSVSPDLGSNYLQSLSVSRQQKLPQARRVKTVNHKDQGSNLALANLLNASSFSQKAS